MARPRKHPEGTTNAERLRLSRQARGTAMVGLPREVVEEIDRLAVAWSLPSRAAVVARLIEAERERRKP